ncbi:MAG: DNA modification methylase [Verrucomicrobia bacterium]|nr:MAG: DNA modification methylase [Verrucomicrobiota bacterium]
MRAARNILAEQQPLLFVKNRAKRHRSRASLLDELAAFRQFRTRTEVTSLGEGEDAVPVFVNEFWTSKQRAASSLHEISYRACFKPQLPRFFIERLTAANDMVYDPFLGRGTTMIEAALLGRRVAGCDINPLSSILTAPRLHPPTVRDVRARLANLDWNYEDELNEELLTFYHPDTLREICALRSHLLLRDADHTASEVDDWIRMVATNRLTGHSAGFFSVYTLPPNQALTPKRQQKINEIRKQVPPRRGVPDLIIRKTESLLQTVSEFDRSRLSEAASNALLLARSSDRTPEIKDNSVDLIVTSPPFLDVVDYAADNWLRCWFNGIEENNIDIWTFRKPSEWVRVMERVFVELRRVLKRGAYIAFEVGEVRRGKLRMEELVVPAAKAAKFIPVLVLINSQVFTKTSNCWGVTNQIAGTNTNRVILLQKPRTQ